MLQGKIESKRNVLQRMKICILNSVHPVSDTRVKRIAETLAEAGNEITIIAPLYGEEDLTVFDETLNISVIGINRKASGSFVKGRGFSGILKTFLSRINVSIELLRSGLETKADVFHCNEMDSWVVGIFLKFVVRSKVIFDAHEYYPSRIAGVTSNEYLSLIVERIFRFSFNFFSLFSDGIIFVNHSLVDLYKFQGKKAIVRNCVRKRDFHPLTVNDDLRRIYKDQIIVLHIGSLREQYGPGALLDSMAFIKDPEVLFLILGGAVDSFITEVENQGYCERIEVIDQLPFKDMLEYLSIADIGIMPLQPGDKNTFYSLARKFLEYIAAGIPVIVSDFPEYRTLVDKYELGLVVDPENPQDIAEAIIKLVEDDRLRRQLGENAARAFEVELNWEMESRKLFDLYDQLKIEN